MNREEVTVQTMNPGHQTGRVFYASLPRDTETPKGQDGEAAKHRLISILWDHLAAMESPLWGFCLSSNRTASPIQVVHDSLGKPHLLLGPHRQGCINLPFLSPRGTSGERTEERGNQQKRASSPQPSPPSDGGEGEFGELESALPHRGPAISFSEGGGRIWAALCEDESDLGIDVAEAVEFQGEYPFHRVFNAPELQHALNLAGGDMEQASALLWSVKEAIVKALGCGFHFVEPLQIHVAPSIPEDDGYTFPVRLLCSPRKDGATVLAERWQMVLPLPEGEGRGEGEVSVRPPPGIGHPKDSPASGNAPARFPGQSLWVRSFPLVKMWLSIAVLNRHIDTTLALRAPFLAATRRMPST